MVIYDIIKKMKILVSGLINIENNTKVHKFPLEYQPISYAFNEVNFCISGTGYNILMALGELGDEVVPLTLLGEDAFGDIIISDLVWKEIKTRYIQRDLANTPTSTVLFDDDGRREILNNGFAYCFKS